jgi:choice-of-anchor B domain-containing protein
MQTRFPLWGALGLAFLAGPLLAHEDDPKLLDRQPPVQAPAYRSALASPGGTNLNLGQFASSGIELLSWLPLNTLDGAQSGNDCWGYVSGSGREYAIIGTYENTIFVEVTNPGNAVVVATINGPDSLWRDIKTYQNYAYAVSEGGSGIQVMDLANIDNGVVTLVGTVNGAGTASTHNVAIDEVSGFLYRSGGSDNGLRIYSLANPASPTFVGSWITRYVHDAQVVTYTTGPFAGRQIAFCCSGFNGGSVQTGLDIVDVTDKANPVSLANAFYPDPAYSHQGWLSEDRQYFYLGDELDEDGSKPTTTHVFDVSDIDDPQYEGSFTNGNTAVGHNMYSLDGILYQANYRSGLRLFDLANPAQPVEMGYFDTYPSNDADGFNGLWSVYPYLPHEP